MENINLADYERGEPADRWKELGPWPKVSLRAVAYEMKPDDVIFAKKGPTIVSKGVIIGPYFFDHRNRIVTSEGVPFQHQVPVRWEYWTQPIRILLGSQQLSAVANLGEHDVRKIEFALSQRQHEIKDVGGQGFGDVQQNLEVEKRSVALVANAYRQRGWNVTSVENLHRGYDLHCTKAREEEHAEVKGVSGDVANFIITPNEIRKAQSDPSFVLFVVTRALSMKPLVHRLSGREFLDRYRLEPIQYWAVHKS